MCVPPPAPGPPRRSMGNTADNFVDVTRSKEVDTYTMCKTMSQRQKERNQVQDLCAICVMISSMTVSSAMNGEMESVFILIIIFLNPWIFPSFKFWLMLMTLDFDH